MCIWEYRITDRCYSRLLIAKINTFNIKNKYYLRKLVTTLSADCAGEGQFVVAVDPATLDTAVVEEVNLNGAVAVAQVAVVVVGRYRGSGEADKFTAYLTYSRLGEARILITRSGRVVCIEAHPFSRLGAVIVVGIAIIGLIHTVDVFGEIVAGESAVTLIYLTLYDESEGIGGEG